MSSWRLFYSVLSVPVTALKTAPMIFHQLPGYEDFTDAEVVDLLGSYFFLVGLIGFGVYVWLHRAAARVYADSVVAAIRAGALKPEKLGALERNVLARLDLLDADTSARENGDCPCSSGIQFLGRASCCYRRGGHHLV